MAVSWIYLLDAAILIAVIIFLLTRKQEWSGPLRWFMAWLGLNAATNVLVFLSRAVPDLTISLSFWLAAYCAATILTVVGLFFARSFEGVNDFAAVFWTLPACFSLSFILVAGSDISIYENGVWRFDVTDRTVMIPLLILFFYAVCSLVYLVKLYLDVRRGSGGLAQRGVAFILGAFIIIFLTNMASPYVRQYVSPLIPLAEIGGTLGGLLIALDLSWVRARKERKQSFI